MPEDFVIATGEQHSVREFCSKAFEQLGIRMEWRGVGISEHGLVASLHPSPLLEQYAQSPMVRLPEPGTALVCVDPAYFRPTEVETLLGDPGKAREKLGWSPQTSFTELVEEMVVRDLNDATREHICQRNGFPLQTSCESHM